MCNLLLFLCVSLGVIHFTKGQVSDIQGVFVEGNAIFLWTPLPQTKREKVSVNLNGTSTHIEVKPFGKYVQQNILKYKTFNIAVLTYFDGKQTYNYSKWYTFKKPKVIMAESGKDKEIRIPLDFIPMTGGYVIKNEDKNVVFFDVKTDHVPSKDTSKYIYVRRSDIEPKSITIKIKSVTTEDAGYISTSVSKLNRNGPGIVLVVKGSPTKPTIKGNADVREGENVTLTCESNSTSAPPYYIMLPPLTYRWYRNGNEIISCSTSNQWTFRVEKKCKYLTVVCMSKEWIHFERSEPFILNLQCQVSDITGVFWEGRASFWWTPAQQTGKETVVAYLNGVAKRRELKRMGAYVQHDVFNYTNVGIRVLTYYEDGQSQYSKFYEFEMPKLINATEGKDKEIEIPIDYIPATNFYTIQKSFNGTRLFDVKDGIVTSTQPEKYKFVRKEERSIIIKIISTKTEDAGYISSGQTPYFNGPGVVLVVKGKPKQPTIEGIRDVQVGHVTKITCQSQSTSEPSYYKMLPPLTYTWYRNNSVINWQTSNNLTLYVKKSDKYDSITCVSRETIVSDSSEVFRLNPLYGPDAVKISPEIPDTVDVIEGESFGPYSCSADCNPSCTYHWKRISESQFDNVGTGPHLSISPVDKSDANEYRCQVDSDYKNSVGSTTAIKTITLRVLYLLEPVVYIDNGIMTTSAVRENVHMTLSCKVKGVPPPQVSLLRDRNILSTGNDWSNYTFSKRLQCEDTGNYTCTGTISTSTPKVKPFLINVLCSARLDVASSPRSLYGSVIGQVTRVIIPVISNPKPQNLTWKKPANADIQTNITQGSVVYKYLIESKIHLKEQLDFGNYTALLGDTELTVITIKALLPPNNVDGLAISTTAILLTWEANDESAPVKTYLIHQLFKGSWKIIANESGVNNKKQFSYVVNQRLSPNRSYDFGINSCNTDICSTLQKVLGIYTLGISSSNLETSLNTISVVGISLGVALVVVLVICLLISITVLEKYRTKRASEMENRQEEHISVTEDENDIENQRLPVENLTDYHEYDTIDESINCQNTQIESSVIPKKEEYQNVVGIIKAGGRGQEIIQMAQYRKEGGYVGKISKSATADIGKHKYENIRHNDGKGGRLFTAMSRNDEPQGSLNRSLRHDDLPRSSAYTSLCPNNEQQGSLYTSLPKDI